MATRRASRKDGSIVRALEGLTDGLYEMFSNRLDLVRYEMVDEARRASRNVSFVVVAGSVFAIGYLMLNASVVLLIGAIFDALWTMAVAAGVLAALHMVAGGIALRRGIERMRGYRFDLEMSKGEFQRDKQWLKEIQKPEEATESDDLVRRKG